MTGASVSAGAHSGYWSQYPGHYEHQRFYDGFSTGWDDAVMFASAGQELGFRGPWVKRRASEHVARRGDGNVWEFGACFRPRGAASF